MSTTGSNGKPPSGTSGHHKNDQKIRKSVFKIRSLLNQEKQANARLHHEILKVKEAFETFSHASSKHGSI
jgi:hypothetical protein